MAAMRGKTVLVLAVLVAALAAFIWFVERDLPSSEEIAERSRKVLPVEPDDVTAVVVEWGGETVRLERARGEDEAGAGDGAAPDEATDQEAPEPVSPGEWRLVEPVRSRAERSAVEGLLTAVTGLDKLRTLENTDPADVGLAEPRGRVTLVTGDGERTLEVGADVPASENVLISLAGASEVWVTPRSFLTHLEREPGEWRSRDVFAAARDDVERIRLAIPGGAEPRVVLVRQGDRFYLEEPVADLASAELVDRVLSDLVTLRARRFLDAPGEEPPPPATLGLDPPRAVVEAELEGGAPLRVELGAPVDEGGAVPETGAGPGAVYARAGGQLFEAVTGLAEAAARPAAAWRSPSWTELRSFEVDRVEVTEGDQVPLTLTREGVDWRRGDETIPYTAASDLLFAVTEAEGELAGDDPEALGEPILTIHLASDEGAEETLTLHPARDDGAFPARSSARQAVLLLPEEAVSGVRRALRDLRDAEPVPAEPDEGE